MIAALVTAVSIIGLKPLASYLGLLDLPGGRKTHAKHTPLIGGIAMYIGFCVAVIFLKHSFLQSMAMLVGAAVLIVIGVLDDNRELNKRIRFLGQILAVSVLVWFGHLSVSVLGKLFFDKNITLGFVSAYFVTLIAVMAYINALNMTDGLDGLAGMLALGQSVFFAYISTSLGYPQIAQFLFILISILIVYLFFNLSLPWRKEASIFMGDAGSTFLAFIIAWFGVAITEKAMQPEHIASGYNLVTILWILGYPLYDLLAVIYSRIKAKKSPATPGRDHGHHILLRCGFSSVASMWIIVSISMCFGFIGIFMEKHQIIEHDQLVCFVMTFILYLFVRNKLNEKTIEAVAVA